MFKKVSMNPIESDGKSHVAKIYDSGYMTEAEIQKLSFDEIVAESYRQQNRDSLADDTARNAFAALYYEKHGQDFEGLQETIQELDTKEVENLSIHFIQDFLAQEGVSETLRTFPQEELQPYILKAIAMDVHYELEDLNGNCYKGTASYLGQEYVFYSFLNADDDAITMTHAEDAALYLMKMAKNEISYEDGTEYDLETKKLAELISKNETIKSIEPEFSGNKSYDVSYIVSCSDYTKSAVTTAEALLLLDKALAEEVGMDTALIKAIPNISLPLLQEDLEILYQNKRKDISYLLNMDKLELIELLQEAIESNSLTAVVAYYDDVKDEKFNHCLMKALSEDLSEYDNIDVFKDEEPLCGGEVSYQGNTYTFNGYAENFSDLTLEEHVALKMIQDIKGKIHIQKGEPFRNQIKALVSPVFEEKTLFAIAPAESESYEPAYHIYFKIKDEIFHERKTVFSVQQFIDAFTEKNPEIGQRMNEACDGQLNKIPLAAVFHEYAAELTKFLEEKTKHHNERDPLL